MAAYRRKLKEKGRLIEARAVEHCIQIARRYKDWRIAAAKKKAPHG